MSRHIVGFEAAMRVKSRKPPAEYLITSLSRDPLEVRSGADDRVGDQMRQMAGDGEHEVVVRRIHLLDLGAERRPEGGEPRDRRRIRASGGVRMHQRPWNKVGEAGIRPAILGAGDRMGGNDRRAGQRRRSAAATPALDEPTSLTIASARQAVGDRRRRRRHRADRHAQDDEIGVGDRGAGLRRRRRRPGRARGPARAPPGRHR